jgi:AraC-like DNA-binding protein
VLILRSSASIPLWGIKSGTFLGEILKNMKRERAEYLLGETGRSVSEIARECGYAEFAVLSAAFKRWTGKSPRDSRVPALRVLQSP